MSEELTQIVLQNQDEFRAYHKSLQATIEKMANSVSDLSTTVARMEERHASHTANMNRVDHYLEDVETRIRRLEQDERLENRLFALEHERAFLRGGWRAIVVVSTIVSGVVGFAIATAVKLVGELQ